MKEEGLSRGQKNWQKVRNILLSKTLSHKQKDKKFTLFQKQTKVQQDKLITTYTYKNYHFIQAAPQPLYKELLHFESQLDSTGKWVWEAEEIAAYYLIHQGKRYLPSVDKANQEQDHQYFKVLELGAGCSGLAAITFAQIYKQLCNHNNLEVLITDGQKENIGYLELNIKLNNLQGNIKASQMVWGDQTAVENLKMQSSSKVKFNLILVCDCLFFTAFHKQLLLTIQSYLTSDGIVLFVNPSRGDSMQEFLNLISNAQFQFVFIDFQEQNFKREAKTINQNESFNKEKDIPYFIELRRKQS